MLSRALEDMFVVICKLTFKVRGRRSDEAARRPEDDLLGSTQKTLPTTTSSVYVRTKNLALAEYLTFSKMKGKFDLCAASLDYEDNPAKSKKNSKTQ
jgi:hypothetical protein